MTAWAAVPLIFQPGTNFAYGPQLAFLGAVMEVADASPMFSQDPVPQARSLEQIMRDIVFDPLGMNDTFFFSQDNDPNRADRLSRIAEDYLAYTFIPARIIIPGLAPGLESFYGSTRPRTNARLDGGLMSTPRDMQIFFKMLKNGGVSDSGVQIIPTTLVAEMSRTQNPNFRIVANTIPRGILPTWGLGVSVVSHQGSAMGTFLPRKWSRKQLCGWFCTFGQIPHRHFTCGLWAPQ